ncbi:siderophore-iron reductase FhuF [Rhizobium mongolense]|uniref:Ferric iron reductase protein FhuF n=2 Tax=Rhizobium mongolense TaxID=57676 RepID=A0ABR6IRA5_9HYPH|nr:siderophore-iron reductase FhuF [Rhizobium mongolense]MBB4230423.1 ferric iron reductase protein FhuF [Rhizobium mongolense]TVZ65504.1 ferric iron reductase protein FhuF [Rhizobium mongolense USDA 1844]
MTTEDGPLGLSPAFSGEHAWCRDKMMMSKELTGGVPLPAFFRDGGFQRAIDRYAEISGGSDRRAVVSMWSLYYFSGLSIPYLLARRLGGQALPVGFEEMTIALEDNGLPRAFGVPHAGTIETEVETESFTAVGPLLETHLGEAVMRLKTCGISAKLCWNNAAVYVDYALRLTGGEPSGGPDLQLFVRGYLPDGGVNPFCGCVSYLDEEGEQVARRKVCCLRYMLPGIPSCGKLCALPSQRNPQ